MKSPDDLPDCRRVLLSNDELAQLLAISSDLEDEKLAFKRRNTHHLYMQFLENSLENMPNKSSATLTINEQHLLEQIAVRCEQGNPMNVSEACLMRQFGCISTVHHQIHKLSAAGLISLDTVQNNRRKKLINLSSDGLKYFKRFEDCLDKALLSQ
jgi:DNA-binding MarR family transcriptional regulator